MFKKKDTEKTTRGFVVKKSDLQKLREIRETRIKWHVTNPSKQPTNKDIYQLQLDIASRQSEIYDMLKKLSTQ